jgi:stage II sporulation protein AB (anti-sigma F factor)
MGFSVNNVYSNDNLRRRSAGEARDEMELVIEAKSQNESYARVAVAAFCARLDPTLEEITDIKTAVSEAVTNCIVHGYEGRQGKIYINVSIAGNQVWVNIRDNGVGIEDIGRAMEPMYTSKPELERSGMGFSFMEAFMDELTVVSEKNRGTEVSMRKTIGVAADE